MNIDSLKVLYITSDTSDYLSDSLFHGLRTLLGTNIVDFPKSDIMYSTSSGTSNLHGKGFTCYGLLEDLEVDRNSIFEKVKSNYFDLIIFSSIHRCFGYFVQYYPWLTKENTIIIDGEDTPSLYLYCGNFWRNLSWFFLPKAHKRFIYFKRELNLETLNYLYYLSIPKFLLKLIRFPKNIEKISFSIPFEKIVKSIPEKEKLFAKHIVDEQVSMNIEGSRTQHVFNNEIDYYKDLQLSKYGISTKRAGWDCIRHYEIAGNGAVICFKDLNKKDVNCAPHGLDSSNCIDYSDYDDLMDKINRISDEEYKVLQQNSLYWVKDNTTVVAAENLLRKYFSRINHP